MDIARAMAIRGLAPASFLSLLLVWREYSEAANAGQLIVIISFLVVVTRLSKLGLDQLVLGCSKEFRETAPVCGQLLSAYLLWSVPTIAALSAVAKWIGANSGYFAYLDSVSLGSLIFISITLVVSQVASVVAQAQKQTLLAVLSFPAIAYTTIAISGLIGLRIELAILLGFVAPIAVSLNILWKWRRSLEFLSPFPWLTKSAAFGIINIATLTYDWAIILIIAEMLSPGEALIFTIASRIGAVLAMPMSVITPYVQSEAANYGKLGNDIKVKKISSDAVIGAFSIQAVLIILIFFLFDKLEFESAAEREKYVVCTVMFAFMQMIHVLTGPAGLVLVMVGQERKIATLNAVAAIITLFSTVIVAGIWGVIGVVFVVCINLLGLSAIYAYLFYKTYNTIILVEAIRSILDIIKIR